MRKSCVLVARAAITKHDTLGGLQQQIIVSQFWRPEVRNQDVGRVASF